MEYVFLKSSYSKHKSLRLCCLAPIVTLIDHIENRNYHQIVLAGSSVLPGIDESDNIPTLLKNKDKRKP